MIVVFGVNVAGAVLPHRGHGVMCVGSQDAPNGRNVEQSAQRIG